MPSEKILSDKQALVAALTEEFKQAQTMVVASARGLTVEQDTAMRAALREAGVTYKVVKNTMAMRAAEAAGIRGMEDIFVGPTAIAYSTEDVVLPAKLAKQFAKKYEAFEIKGGMTGGQASTVQEMERLAGIPDLPTLYTQLAYVLNFPITKFAATLKSVVDKGEETGQANVVDLVVAAAAETAEAVTANASIEAV